MKPLCIDVFCGLGGWTEGFLAEGWECIGFDLERHDYGSGGYPAQLVRQDALTIHGKQFRQADCLVMSPPCQEFSYMAMPFSRGKQIARALRGEDEFPAGYRGSRTVGELTALFDACFRIQREASAAAGRHIPMVVENVKGAEPWVGRARGRFGSFLLWGDVPALMPSAQRHMASKNSGGSWFAIGSPGQKELARNPVRDGVKKIAFDAAGTRLLRSVGNSSFGWDGTMNRTHSGSDARKAASAQIAKIPPVLSRYIAATYRPRPVTGNESIIVTAVEE